MGPLRFVNIEEALVDALPELRPAAERYWSAEGRPGEDTGAYSFYEHVFGTYLEILLALAPSFTRDRLLKRAFFFVDAMLMSSDEEVTNLACIALLEGRDPWWLTRAMPFLGPLALDALDECFEGWRLKIDKHWMKVPWPGESYLSSPVGRCIRAGVRRYSA